MRGLEGKILRHAEHPEKLYFGIWRRLSDDGGELCRIPKVWKRAENLKGMGLASDTDCVCREKMRTRAGGTFEGLSSGSLRQFKSKVPLGRI